MLCSRLDQATFEELWKILSEARKEDRLTIAALAILHSDPRLRAQRFAVYNMSDSQPVIKANAYLHKLCFDPDKVSFAIAILDLENSTTTKSGEKND
jgi:hypothetical protein